MTSSGGGKKIDERRDHTRINDEIAVVDGDAGAGAAAGRPKSKKELRLERKAAAKKRKKAQQEEADEEGSTAAAAAEDPAGADNGDGDGKLLDKDEYDRRKKLRKAEERKAREKLMRKELREEKKARKRRKINREMNAKGGGGATTTTTRRREKPKAAVPGEASGGGGGGSGERDERDVSMNAFRSVVYGTSGGGGSSSKGGTTTTTITTRLGVRYTDAVVGTGRLLREGRPATVRYELTGGKFGAVLDSSDRFTFRPGMGEVIRGWDVGLEGMREGGRRKLVVPPKAGYGGKDIGAGPGALLHFEVTLLSSGK